MKRPLARWSRGAVVLLHGALLSAAWGAVEAPPIKTSGNPPSLIISPSFGAPSENGARGLDAGPGELLPPPRGNAGQSAEAIRLPAAVTAPSDAKEAPSGNASKHAAEAFSSIRQVALEIERSGGSAGVFNRFYQSYKSGGGKEWELIAQDPTPIPESGPLLELSLGGVPFKLKVLETSEEQEQGLMSRKDMPGDGVLYRLARGKDEEVGVWHKNILIPEVDYVFAGADGRINGVYSRVPASPPETPWTEVPILEGYGAWVFALRGGAAEGLRLGQRVDVPASPEAGTSTRGEEASPAQWQAWMALDGGEGGVREVIDYFRKNPDRVDVFRQMLERMNRAIAEAAEDGDMSQAWMYLHAKSRLFAHAMRGSGLSHHLLGSLSLSDPMFWMKHLSRGDQLRALVWLPGELIATFLHEGGHALVGRLLGRKIRGFYVYPSGGGSVEFVPGEESAPWKDVAIAAAGPLVELFWSAFQAIAGLAPLAFTSAYYGRLFALGGMDLIAGALLASALLAWVGFSGLRAWALRAHFDWVDIAWAAGFKRLSLELYWRFKLWRRGELRYRSYYGLLRSLFFP